MGGKGFAEERLIKIIGKEGLFYLLRKGKKTFRQKGEE